MESKNSAETLNNQTQQENSEPLKTQGFEFAGGSRGVYLTNRAVQDNIP